jgi:hypothetical protein
MLKFAFLLEDNIGVYLVISWLNYLSSRTVHVKRASAKHYFLSQKFWYQYHKLIHIGHNFTDFQNYKIV